MKKTKMLLTLSLSLLLCSIKSVVAQMIYPVDTVGVSAITFVNEKTGFALCDYCVKKTLDGGKTWKTIKKCKEDQFKTIYFISPTTGFLGGYQDLQKTTDGGVSWTKQIIPGSKDADIEVCGFYFSDPLKGFAVGSAVEPQGGIILRTVDGGSHWKIVLQADPGSMLDHNDLYTIRFADKNHGVAGGSNVILYTKDGGATWLKADHDYEKSETHLICPIDSMDWFADGGQYGTWIVKSTDGGATWVPAFVSDEPTGFKSMIFTDSKNGFASRMNEFTFTTDGGRTWGKVNFPYDNILYQISLIPGTDKNNIRCFTSDSFLVIDSLSISKIRDKAIMLDLTGVKNQIEKNDEHHNKLVQEQAAQAVQQKKAQEQAATNEFVTDNFDSLRKDAIENISDRIYGHVTFRVEDDEENAGLFAAVEDIKLHVKNNTLFTIDTVVYHVYSPDGSDYSKNEYDLTTSLAPGEEKVISGNNIPGGSELEVRLKHVYSNKIGLNKSWQIR